MVEWRATRAMRDERERRDGRDGRRFEVSETSNPELRVALFPPVSLESGIGDYSRSAHE
jgi:hypothetical protein